MPYVPIEWLREHVDVPSGTTAARLAADLVKVGIEEERIVPPAVTGPLVVGRVLTREAKKHTNGKVINYCRVDVGEYNDAPGAGKEPSELPSRGIVCGAHNFDVGDSVVVCLPGAVLPGDFAISARKTYGHVSDGMICSERELGLGADHDGIIVLSQWLAAHGRGGEEPPAPGTDAIPLLGLGEEVLEVNITPDRGYCFSMRGIAREYSHATGARFTDPADAADAALYPHGVAPAGDSGFEVRIPDDPSPVRGRPGADRYVARIVRGIDPTAPSPKWMRDRLTAAGMRPISLAVDVTNYVMLDLGQPLHAFDLAKLHAPIVVRRAAVGETLAFLDDVTRTLDAADLVISDSPDGPGSRALVLAGVFGGADTEVDARTTDILIEAAHFDPVSIARSARRHRLPTESSKRNERGVDTELAPVAAQRAVDLLVEYGGGTADPVATDVNRTTAPRPIIVRADTAERLTGVAYGTERVVGLLEAIGCAVEPAGDDGAARAGRELLAVTPPTWRPDLVGPAHFAEEIARLDGYDSIPVVVPAAPAGTGLTPRQQARREVVRALADAGLTQVLSYPFIGDVHDVFEIPADDPRRDAVRLANPLAEDAPCLRTSVLDSLVEAARRNVSRGLDDVAVYEIGAVTLPAGTVPAAIPGVDRRPSEEEIAALEAGIPAQPTHVGAVLAGERERAGVLGPARPWTWSDAVEVVRTAARALGVTVEVAAPAEPRAPWHPGRTAEVRLPGARRGRDVVPGAVVGHAGELHPRVVRALGLPERACALEIDLEPLLEAVEAAGVLQVRAVSTFPAGKEDIALVVDEAVAAAAVEAVIREAAGDLLEEVRLFDVFRGPQLGEGRKSLAFSLRLRAPDRTLTAGELAGVRKRVVKRAAKRLGAELRA